MNPSFLELNNREIVLPSSRMSLAMSRPLLHLSPFSLDSSPLHTDLFPPRTPYQLDTPNL